MMARYLPCISVRQPWAWLITHQTEYPHGKTIENRSYPPLYQGREYRGPILIHAGKKPDENCWDPQGKRFDMGHVTVNGRPVKPLLPAHFPQVPYQESPDASFEEKCGGWSRDHAGMGGIVGIAMLVGVREPGSTSDSFWYFSDQYGLRLRNARPLPFFACPGKQGIFTVDMEPMLAYYRQIIIDGHWTWPLLEECQ